MNGTFNEKAEGQGVIRGGHLAFIVRPKRAVPPLFETSADGRRLDVLATSIVVSQGNDASFTFTFLDAAGTQIATHDFNKANGGWVCDSGAFVYESTLTGGTEAGASTQSEEERNWIGDDGALLHSRRETYQALSALLLFAPIGAPSQEYREEKHVRIAIPPPSLKQR